MGRVPLGKTKRPRLAFLGLGWIGRHRMQAIADSELAEIVALADPAPDCIAAAAALVPGAAQSASIDDLLDAHPDGVVIATPSALHADQAVAALERGAAVFCQKPLGRTAAEAARAVRAAEAADRILSVDLSYRHTAAMRAIRDTIRRGELGDVFAADLVFHNAYGPDKPWFYKPALSGGGCVMDLGVHLVDMALWLLDFPAVTDVSAQLFAAGRPLTSRDATEDYATATLTLETGAVVRIACSWNLSAGRDAVIEADIHGTSGGASMRNRGGSFFDFEASCHSGTASRLLCAPPDDWGGRAAVHWVECLTVDQRFDPDVWTVVRLSEVIDRIYGAALEGGQNFTGLRSSASPRLSASNHGVGPE